MISIVSRVCSIHLCQGVSENKINVLLSTQYPISVLYPFDSLRKLLALAERTGQNSKMASLPELILSILADKCYELHNITNSTVVADNGKMCLPIFDGLYCWPYTKAGELVVQPCSNYVLKSTNQVS